MVPKSPKIYHITHIENLPQIIGGFLWSDAERLRRGLNCRIVGMGEIKRRRLQELEVHCHPGSKVGEYVPFYFCPRSIMLFLLHKGNHLDLTFTGGQRPIVHLQVDFLRAIDWATSAGRKWAFSTGNAGARYARFFSNIEDLSHLDWSAIGSWNWKDLVVRERKQAEALIEGHLPWHLIERIGVIDSDTAAIVDKRMETASHRPRVVAQRNWYY